MGLEQSTLRETLAEQLTAIETPAVEVEKVTEVPSEPAQTTTERVRDEAGKFAKKTEEEPAIEAKAEPVAEVQKVEPSTWKKDYWEKFDALDPDLQTYINERENQYKTGVSTYAAEARNAKALNDAIAPFIPTLQQNNIEPTTWIRNLGTAHQTLALGSPQQKLQMFQQLARDYGVDLNQVSQFEPQQVDPQSQWLMQQVNTLSQDLNSFKSQQKAAEAQTLQSEISKFAENAPHFELVRDTMAGLLQAGLAQDLQTAYDKAIRMNDETWQKEQDRLAQVNIQHKVQAANQAKAAAVSVKSSTPSGNSKTTEAKGIRSLLEESFDSLSSRV